MFKRVRLRTEGDFSVDNARRDAIVLAVLVAAVFMLIWNGSDFFEKLTLAGREMGPQFRVTATALILNVILIIFGWRRYADLQHEASMRRDSEARAALIASTDGMTGLLNRKGFADKGEELRAAAEAAGRELLVLSLQLNRFKSVNDRHGYDVGDAVIREIASSISRVVGTGRLVARLSGDEFAIAAMIEPGTAASGAALAAEILSFVTRPIDALGRMIQVGAFIGAATSPAREPLPYVLRRADIALDHARTSRSARAVWFDEGMERALVAQGEIEQGIRGGLDNHQFVPYFEPQVDLLTGEIVGFEVLARWDHPLGGTIGPDRFIPIAEEHGLIGRLSEQVMLAAMTRALEWDPSITLSVNISPTQLSDSWLAQRIVRLLAEANFPAERLVVEITESSLFSDIDLARSIVTSLKNQGVRLALDDFGTGFSSLAHLRALPFDVIKIDRSFISTLDSQHESAAIVRAVTTLAEALKVKVTAEGIEDARTHAALAGMGCNMGQGWYFGKAMSGDQALSFLRSRADRPQGHNAAKRAS